ncbi:MAG: ABC transporter ATP-binding protein [Candidatus Merdivicinus sp.]|jgi:ABC-type sugar transport system ATPase subunit
MIQLNGVVKEYGNIKNKEVTRAVDGIDLDIRQGEFIALLGPSGCGKTTTLMMIAGLLKATKGEILFDGKLVNHMEPKDRNIGMVFQSYALYPHLKVIDNIAFPLREKKMPKAEAYEKARKIAKKLQIENLLDRKPSQLSGGQQQRVAMARALVKEPQILLLDEPMSNLDARLKLDLRDEIRKLQREIGVTTIIVTHDQEEALAISDRVAVLDAGKIQQYDTPYNLYHKPKNLFIANFLGTPPMNIMEGSVEEKDGCQIFVSEGIRYVLPQQKQIAKEHIGCRIAIGLRPNDIKLSNSTDNTISARIELVEQLGAEQLIKVKPLNSNHIMRIVADNETSLKAGDTVQIMILENKFHLFNLEQNGINILD